MIWLLLLLLAKPILAQTPPSALADQFKNDYQYQHSLYQKSLSTYKNDLNVHKKYNSIDSQKKLIDSSRNLLFQQSTTLKTYLSYLRVSLYLNQLPDQTNQIKQQLQDQENWLQSFADSTSTNQLSDLTQTFNDQIDQILSTILQAQIIYQLNQQQFALTQLNLLISQIENPDPVWQANFLQHQQQIKDIHQLAIDNLSKPRYQSYHSTTSSQLNKSQQIITDLIIKTESLVFQTYAPKL